MVSQDRLQAGTVMSTAQSSAAAAGMHAWSVEAVSKLCECLGTRKATRVLS